MKKTKPKYPICFKSKVSKAAYLIASDKKAIVVEFDKYYKNIRFINDMNFVNTQKHCLEAKMFRAISLDKFKSIYLKVNSYSDKYISGYSTLYFFTYGKLPSK